MEALSLGPVKRLLGVNLDGWLEAGGSADSYQGFVSERELGQLASWRLMHVRLPVEVELLDSADGWRALDTALTRCLRHGLGVVLALRVTAHTRLFSSRGAWRGLGERWRQVAERYRDSGALFDLLDRPQPPSEIAEEVLTEMGAPRLSIGAARRQPAPGVLEARAWGALAVRLTEEIREVDDEAELIVQSVAARPAAFAQLRPTRDGRTRYSFHAFAPESLTLRGEGIYPGLVDGEQWDRERLAKELEPALVFARTYAAPLYLGAFGVTDAAPRTSRLTWLRSLLSLCRRSGIGWAYWSYRDRHFGLAVEGAVDYDLLGVLQSE